MSRPTGITLLAGLVLFVSESSFGCSCISSTLENRYERSTNVFRAVVTSAEFVDCPDRPPGLPEDWSCRRYEAGFEVIAKYKGNIPFNKLQSHIGSASCGVSLTVGKEYVFFTGDKGGVSLCSGTIYVSEGRELDIQWVQMLEDFSAGAISDLSNSWTSSEHNRACGLNTKFGIPTGRHGYEYSALFSARFRPAGINVLTGDKDSSRKSDETRIKLRLFVSEKVVGDFVWLSANGVDVKAVWTGEDLGYRAYVVDDRKAIAVLKQLDNVDQLIVEGPTSGKSKLVAKIRTTNAGTAIHDFMSCAGLK